MIVRKKMAEQPSVIIIVISIVGWSFFGVLVVIAVLAALLVRRK